jgi:endonuclease YncB( thermonuclease family)
MRRAGGVRPTSNVTGGTLARRGIAAAAISASIALTAALGFSGDGPGTSATSTKKTAAGTALVGRAIVIDGDTVEIHGEHVRINGVDAPESRQTCTDGQGRAWHCGTVAASALGIFLAASRPLRCAYVDRDRYGRFVGNCFRADGTNVAAWLAGSGYALDWPRYSGGAYAAEQARAREAKAGIWSGTFEAPWNWRVVTVTGNRPGTRWWPQKLKP